MILSVHQPHYLPWIGYLDKIKKSDAFIFLDNVQYKKREFQNRNKIRTREGWQWLTVPVITKDRYYQKISEVEIDNETPWAVEHWKSIAHNYARAKHFHEYQPAFEEAYGGKWERLSDLHIHLTKMLLAVFAISTPLYFESDMPVETSSTQRIIDLCRKLNADTYLSGSGGKAYMDEQLFADNNIRLVYQEFQHPAYPQSFQGFEPFMSVIDYLFNCGPAFAF
jgi:hypothetical protein